jgi:hypothetical protein
MRRMPSTVSCALSIQVFRLHSVFAHDDLVDRPGDLKLPLAGLGHADRIDRQCDECGAVLLRERHDVVDTLAAILHVDGVDDRAPGYVLQRGFDDVALCRVDHERCFDAHREQLHDLRHLLRLVSALGERDAHVEHMRAGVLLLARDFEDALVVIGQQQPLHLARSLRVHALANEQWRRFLTQRGRAHRGRHERLAPMRAQRRGRCRTHGLDDARQVFRRCATATANNAHAELLHELAQHGGHWLGLERIDRLARAGVEGQASVGNDRDGQGRMLGHEPDRLAHVLGAGRTVQPDHVHIHGLERCHGTRDVGAEEHAAARVERDLRLDGDTAPDLGEQPLEARDGGLYLEDVLRGLHE